MKLEYKDICIRNIENKDLEQLATWWNDGSIMAHAGFPNGLGISVKEIEEKIKNDSDDTRRRLIIEYKDKLIGEMNYSICENHVYEIGIKICDSNYQEKGFGRIILSTLIEELFNRGANLICLDTNLKNSRAQHIYELLGFKKVAIHKDSWRNQIGELQTTVDYELTRNDFHDFK